MGIGTLARVGGRTLFAKALSQSEPCKRTRRYRRHVKRDLSTARRLEAKKLIKEAEGGG